MLQGHKNISNGTQQVKRQFGIRRLAMLGFVCLGLSVTFGLSAPTQAFAATASATCENEYSVVAGDTLSAIAVRHKANWQTLASQNHLGNPDLIFVGQKLCLSGTATSESQQQQPAQEQPVQEQPAEQVSEPVNPPVTQQVPAQPASTSVEGMIEEIFGPHAESAKRVAMCESTMNPSASNAISVGGSHAAGLFQILYPSTWNTTSQAGNSPYDARANILAAYEIFQRDGYSWRQWVCQ